MTITSKLDIVHSMWVENCVYEFAGKIPLMEGEIQAHSNMFPTYSALYCLQIAKKCTVVLVRAWELQSMMII